MKNITVKLSTTIFISSIFSLLLLIYKETYPFMIWNLLLALIPLFLSNLLVLLEKKIKFKIILLPLFILWLLFFPNSPYMITDFLHLSYLGKWDKFNNLYNVLVLFSSVWSGLIAGLFSIYQVHFIIEKYMSKILSWLVIVFIFALSGFGIYIGRFSRLNSWDILQNYSSVIKLIIDFTHKLYANNSLIEFVIVISILSLICYITFCSIVGINLNSSNDKN